MTGTAYKITSAIIIIILVVLLIIVAAAYINCQTQQPQIIYRTQQKPVAHITWQQGYSIDQNTFNTTIIIENRGASGLIMVEYLSLGNDEHSFPFNLGRKEYYITSEERKTIIEIWKVSDGNYVVCNIIYQRIAD